MRAIKHGNKYRVTYRCAGFPELIHETFDTEDEANLRVAQLMLQKKHGPILPPPELVDPSNHEMRKETMTVSQLMDEYVQLYGLKHWSAGTLSDNQHRIDDYIKPYIGNMPIKMLTTHRLETFYDQLQSMPAVKMKGKAQKTIAPSVIEKVHALIRNALNQALRWNYLDGVNPAMTVELPSHRKNKRASWTDQEARHALEVCVDPVLKLCMYLALGCSMRIGEILGLTWDSVHIDDELIQNDEAYLSVKQELRRCDKRSIDDLRKQGRDDIYFTFPPWKKTESTTVLVLKAPKTESSVRDIYIPAVVAEELKQARARQTYMKTLLTDEYQDYGLVVTQENGRPVESCQIMDKLRKLIKEHDLKPVVFHSLRHSSTSLKLKISGGDIKAVQGDTGHAQARMVTDVYSHIMTDDRKNLAKKVNDQFLNKKNVPSAPPALGLSQVQIIQLLQASPELAEPLLKMYKILDGENA